MHLNIEIKNISNSCISDREIHMPAPNPSDPLRSPPRLIRPKYQVFVSSTYSDLYTERSAITWEVLKLGHIPTGMENFSAEHDRGWKVIRKTIDNTDYYILLLAGRYGSIDPSSGISWTEQEYEYAISKNVPVLAFIRERSAISGDLIDMGDSQKQLQKFIDKVRSRHHVEPWSNQDDLRAKVATALAKTILEAESDEDARPGWYRGNQLPPSEALEELARLSAENRALRKLETYTDLSDAWPRIKNTIEARVSANNSVRVRILGMSMEYAWPSIQSMLIQYLQRKIPGRIDISIAMLNPGWSQMNGFSSAWSTAAPVQHQRILGFINSRREELSERGWTLSVHGYEHIPNWHGFLLDNDFLFLGSCKWMGEELIGGEYMYELYNRENALGVEKIDRFNGWFDFCVRTSATTFVSSR
ncbi:MULTISPECIES: DUF4062 domain-containing protein [Sorangium]|uniref:DUF4062 domain-containing protein n=1 Tax=Sorangium TaxID=39643 RepID=UPI003D9C33AC